MSSFLAEPLTGADYGAYLARAKRRGRIPEAIVAELNAVHRLRNGALHQGAEVGADDVQRAILSARTVLDEYIPRVLKSARALGYGSGIPDAVAALLVAHDPISYRLTQGSIALARRNDAQELEHAAAALHFIETYAEPRLPAPDPFYVRGELVGTVSRKGESWRRSVEAWLIPMALGLTPASYAKLRDDLPSLSYIPGSNERGGKFVFRPGGDNALRPGVARRSLETVSLLALRLWLRDSLRYPKQGQD